MSEFKTKFGENVFRFKYAQGPGDTWAKLMNSASSSAAYVFYKPL